MKNNLEVKLHDTYDTMAELVWDKEELKEKHEGFRVKEFTYKGKIKYALYTLDHKELGGFKND